MTLKACQDPELRTTSHRRTSSLHVPAGAVDNSKQAHYTSLVVLTEQARIVLRHVRTIADPLCRDGCEQLVSHDEQLLDVRDVIDVLLPLGMIEWEDTFGHFEFRLCEW